MQGTPPSFATSCSIPNSAPAELGAYSLSKSQGAWWFFIILTTYLLIGIVTGDFSNSINSTALILLGIGGGTVLGSAAIDASKIEQRKADLTAAKAQRAALAAGAAGIAAADAKVDALNGKSVNFLQDILSDGNGVNFHRFQLPAWTLVLSMIFIGQVYTDLAMQWSVDDSATEIAPCCLSLIGGVEFLENRFDGVRVEYCFVVEPYLDARASIFEMRLSEARRILDTLKAP